MSDQEARPRHSPLVPPGGVECLAGDMVAMVSGEVALGVLQARLGEVGQWVPIDGEETGLIGELVEGNSTGALRLGYGGWRDLLLGVQFLNGRGELITAGGQTVKNVAGYDLTKLMVGQRGSLGKIVTVTVRTYRRPEMGLRVKLGADVGIPQRLMATPLRPRWMMLTPGGLWLGYLGDEATIGYYQEAAKTLSPLEVRRQTVQGDIAFRAGVFKGRNRLSVPPAGILEFVATHGLREWAADAAFGILVTDQDPPAAPTPSVAEAQLLGRLKDAFDPEHRLPPLPGVLG